MGIGAGIKAKRINTYKSSCHWHDKDCALQPLDQTRTCTRISASVAESFSPLPSFVTNSMMMLFCCWEHKSATNKQQPSGCWAVNAMTKGTNKGPEHCTLDPLNPAHCVSLIMTPHHVLYTGDTNTCGNCRGHVLVQFQMEADGKVET